MGFKRQFICLPERLKHDPAVVVTQQYVADGIEASVSPVTAVDIQVAHGQPVSDWTSVGEWFVATSQLRTLFHTLKPYCPISRSAGVGWHDGDFFSNAARLKRCGAVIADLQAWIRRLTQGSLNG